MTYKKPHLRLVKKIRELESKAELEPGYVILEIGRGLPMIYLGEREGGKKMQFIGRTNKNVRNISRILIPENNVDLMNGSLVFRTPFEDETYVPNEGLYAHYDFKLKEKGL